MTLTAAEVRSTTFPAASRLRRGYDADEVDAFVERLAVRLETGAGLTSNEVYRLELGKARVGGRGYAEADVDAFLGAVHLELVRLEDAWGHEGSADPAPTDADTAPADGNAPTGTDAGDVADGGTEADTDTAAVDGDAPTWTDATATEPEPDDTDSAASDTASASGDDTVTAAALPADGEAPAEIAVEDPQDGADRPAGPR